MNKTKQPIPLSMFFLGGYTDITVMPDTDMTSTLNEKAVNHTEPQSSVSSQMNEEESMINSME